MAGNDMTMASADAGSDGNHTTSTATEPSINTRSLAESIAASTRSAHAKLNKLIVARLPLALPPNTADPSLYASGILHIAPIYITFEALWQNILDTPPESTPTGSISDGCDPDVPILDDRSFLQRDNEEPLVHRALVCDRLHTILDRLHLPGLLRTNRLKDDIKAMTGWPDHVVEDQLRTVSQEGRLADLLKHMKRSVENRPHVLLAYSYIFFMALFAGGRFIRASLESVGEDFWQQIPSPIKPTMHACEESHLRPNDADTDGAHRSHAASPFPLRFFHFPTPSDGEDLKREFKKRLSESEALLSSRENQEIVKEAVCIFENMNLLMGQLDTVCGGLNDEAKNPADLGHRLGWPRSMLASRLRDSVAVAKERRSVRNSSRQTSSEYSVCDLLPGLRGDAEKAATAGCIRANTFPQPLVSMGESLCPAMSDKAVRFEESPHPRHGSFCPNDRAAKEYSVGHCPVSKVVCSTQVLNWLIILALGVFLLGVFVAGRHSFPDLQRGTAVS